MDSTFGEFITKEYGLLRQILSYLKPRDLHKARNVCREWRSAVDSITEKNPRPIILQFNEDDFHKMYIPKNLIPDLVIYQNIRHINRNKCPKICKLCKNKYFWCPFDCSHDDSIFLTLLTKYKEGTDLTVIDDPSPSYLFWKTMSLLIIPSSSKIQVSTFVAESNSHIFKEPVTNDVVNRCVGGEEPIKCLLIISKAAGSSASRIWIDSVINQLIQRQGMTFALGGGDMKNTLYCKRSNCKAVYSWKKYDLSLVAFRGDNVTAHSELLSSFENQPIEDVITQMGTTVGPVPENGSRVAFISQCVDRIPYEIVESSAFRRTFPDVPQFGFQAYGEFGFKNSSLGDSSLRKRNKKMKITFKHTHTTSIVILTFSKI